MMMHDYVTRRGYDERVDGPDWWYRHGRGGHDPRWDGHLRHANGDWMREPRWLREQPVWSRMHEAPYEPMVKVIEVFAESPYSWEDATRRAIAEASHTVRGIRSIYVQDMQAIVEDDRVIGFRINAKIAFTLDDARRRR